MDSRNVMSPFERYYELTPKIKSYYSISCSLSVEQTPVEKVSVPVQDQH